MNEGGVTSKSEFRVMDGKSVRAEHCPTSLRGRARAPILTYIRESVSNMRKVESSLAPTANELVRVDGWPAVSVVGSFLGSDRSKPAPFLPMPTLD